MPMSPRPSVERLREILEYRDGELYWIVDKASNAPRGSVAGRSLGSHGYRQIAIDGYRTVVHRVVWALFYGEWPEGHLDHVDGDRESIQIENLRLATPGQNMMNTRLRKDNKTGLKGVTVQKGAKVFRTKITVNGHQIWLGEFKTAQAAHEAYAEAAKLHFGEFARTS